MGNWQVSDGGIPEVIEKWLLKNAVSIERVRKPWTREYTWALYVDAPVPMEGYHYFDWPREKTPSLTEAILAVANKGE